MPTFAEVSSNLDKALKDLSAKKDALDKLTEQIQKANADYQSSVANAQEVKQQMHDILESHIPSPVGSTRIR